MGTIMIFRKALVAAAVLMLASGLLAGCNSVPDHAVKADVPSRKVERSFERMEIEILDELRILAKIRDEKRMAAMTADQKADREKMAESDALPDVMRRRVSISIPPKEAGEVCLLLADVMEYKSMTVGVAPHQTIWTSIELRDEPFFSAVYELGRQTGEAFDMEIYPESELVRCVYRRRINYD